MVEVTVEEEETPVGREVLLKRLEWPRVAALGTIVVTNTDLTSVGNFKTIRRTLQFHTNRSSS